jgi:hypothetical protein
VRFFVGLHQPSDAKHFDSAFINVARLRPRKTMVANDWILDSGAFTEISKHGRYRWPPGDYAEEIRRWSKTGNLLAAVAQDYMCEDEALKATGLSVLDHQRLTIERYDTLLALDPGVYVMPVIQGYTPTEYAQHIHAYGARLKSGAWVGLGSICKRNGDVGAIEEVFLAVRRVRPDLRLHGFGLKTTALGSGLVRKQLATADSMAWSLHARKNGRNANDWREAKAFADKIESMPYQESLL